LKAALNTIKLNKTKFKQVEQMFPWLQRLQIFGLFSVILSGYRYSLMQHCLIFISNAFSLSNIIMVNMEETGKPGENHRPVASH
jgi:hypothetical protein